MQGNPHVKEKGGKHVSLMSYLEKPRTTMGRGRHRGSFLHGSKKPQSSVKQTK